MPIIITAENYPAILDAFQEIEIDNGAHLIGHIYPGDYPGDTIPLDRFEIPDTWAPLLDKAETALDRLRQKDGIAFQDFICGDEKDAAEIAERQGDLGPARHLLDAYFNDWPEPAPEILQEASST